MNHNIPWKMSAGDAYRGRQRPFSRHLEPLPDELAIQIAGMKKGGYDPNRPSMVLPNNFDHPEAITREDDLLESGTDAESDADEPARKPIPRAAPARPGSAFSSTPAVDSQAATQKMSDIDQDRPHFFNLLGQYANVEIRRADSGLTDHIRGRVSSSLGVAYHNAMKQVIASSSTDSKVFIFPLFVHLSHDKMEHPAAVSIVGPDLSFAVVSDHTIIVFRQIDPPRGTKFEDHIVCDHLKSNARGLGTTSNKNLVTIVDANKIVIYKNALGHKNEMLCRVEYNPAPKVISRRYNPCFMDVCNGKMIISDLGKNTLSLWRIEEGEHSSATVILEKTTNVSIPRQGKIEMVSGVQLDVDGYSVVGDARSGTLQIYDPSLNYVAQIHPRNTSKDEKRLPYFSSFTVTKAFAVIACDRHNHQGGLVLWKLATIPVPYGMEVPR